MDLSARIGALSHGNRQKVGVVQAFMHQPVVEGSTAELLAIAAPYRIERIVTHEADLEEIFVANYAEA